MSKASQLPLRRMFDYFYRALRLQWEREVEGRRRSEEEREDPNPIVQSLSKRPHAIRAARSLTAVSFLYERWWRAASSGPERLRSNAYGGAWGNYYRVSIWDVTPTQAWDPTPTRIVRRGGGPQFIAAADGRTAQMIVCEDLLITEKGFDPNVLWLVADLYDQVAYDSHDEVDEISPALTSTYEWEVLIREVSDDTLHVIFDAAIEGRRIDLA